MFLDVCRVLDLSWSIHRGPWYMLDHFGSLSTYLSDLKCNQSLACSTDKPLRGQGAFGHMPVPQICHESFGTDLHVHKSWQVWSQINHGIWGTYSLFSDKSHQAPEQLQILQFYRCCRQARGKRKHCQRHLMLRPALRHQKSLWLFSMAWMHPAMIGFSFGLAV